MKIQEGYYHDEHHFERLKISMHMIDAYKNLGEYEIGRAFLEKELASFKEPYTVKVASIFHSLGNIYGKLEEVEKGCDFLKKALDIKEQGYGMNHYELITTLICLSETYLKLGEYSKACSLLERVLLIQQGHYGTDSFQVGFTLDSLGKVCGILGDYEKASQYLKKNLHILEERVLREHENFHQNYLEIKNISVQLADIEKILALLGSGQVYKIKIHFDEAKEMIEGDRLLLKYPQLKLIKIQCNKFSEIIKNMSFQYQEISNLISEVVQFNFSNHRSRNSELKTLIPDLERLDKGLKKHFPMLDNLLEAAKGMTNSVSKEHVRIIHQLVLTIGTLQKTAQSLAMENQEFIAKLGGMDVFFSFMSPMIEYAQTLAEPSGPYDISVSDDEDLDFPLSPTGISSALDERLREEKQKPLLERQPIQPRAVLAATTVFAKKKVRYLIPRLNKAGVDNKALLLELKISIIRESYHSFEIEAASSLLSKSVRDKLSLDRGWVKSLDFKQHEDLKKIDSVRIEKGNSKTGEEGFILTFFSTDSRAVNRILKDRTLSTSKQQSLPLGTSSVQFLQPAPSPFTESPSKEVEMFHNMLKDFYRLISPPSSRKRAQSSASSQASSSQSSSSTASQSATSSTTLIS